MEDISRKISVVFRVLVLTVPSQYLVAYFTFWQFRVTQLDTVMGMIMLVIQVGDHIYMKIFYKTSTSLS